MRSDIELFVFVHKAGDYTKSMRLRVFSLHDMLRLFDALILVYKMWLRRVRCARFAVKWFSCLDRNYFEECDKL